MIGVGLENCIAIVTLLQVQKRFPRFRPCLPLASRIEHIGTHTHPVHLIGEVWVNRPKYGLEPFDWLLRIVVILLGDI